MAMFVDLRDKHGDLGEDSNLADFFKVALARRDAYDQEQNLYGV